MIKTASLVRVQLYGSVVKFLNFKIWSCLAFTVYSCFMFTAFCNKTLEKMGRKPSSNAHSLSEVTACLKGFWPAVCHSQEVFLSVFLFCSFNVPEQIYFVVLFNIQFVWGKIKTYLVWNCSWEYDCISSGLNERPRETGILLPLRFIFHYSQITMILPLHPCPIFLNTIISLLEVIISR